MKLLLIRVQTMKNSLIVIIVAVITATGCVSDRQNLELVNRKNLEHITNLKGQLAERDQRLLLLTESNATLIADAEHNQTLTDQIIELAATNDDLKKQLQTLAAAVPQLPAELKNALQSFADRFPTLATFSPNTSSVKFASDLTFPLGSDSLSQTAIASLANLAGVLNSSDAVKYEIKVVGHTDNIRIAKPATKTKHPTNTHLSVHRAIAVANALKDAGVAKKRLCVAGYGYQRPVVANTPTGASANRRVEIYLVPMAPVNDQFLKSLPQPPDTENAAAPNMPASTIPTTSSAIPTEQPTTNDTISK